MHSGWNTIAELFWAFLIFIVLGYAIVSLLIIIPTWRILRRAGFSGAISLMHLLPVVGSLIVLAVLAFSTWPAGEAPSPRRGAQT